MKLNIVVLTSIQNIFKILLYILLHGNEKMHRIRALQGHFASCGSNENKANDLVIGFPF